ncbi:MAG: (Fe-S)-binding protein [archaeon]|nr:(Fe-S)-binding protein [archaeon]
MGLDEKIKASSKEVQEILTQSAIDRKKKYFPKKKTKARINDLLECMLCPNMCRFDCGSLQAAETETMSPSYKAKIGYYISMGIIDPLKEENKPYVDLMYKCSNEEACKAWCPQNFSVVSLLERVRWDLNKQGIMPDFCKKRIENLKNTNTIEDHNIFETYKEKGIENIETNGNDEVYYYIGCESMKFPEVVKANIKILKKAGVNFSTNLEKKSCCGGPAFNIKDIKTAKEFGNKNKAIIESTGAKIVVSDCPGCIETLSRRYKQVNIHIEAKFVHISTYIKELIDVGKIKFENKIPDEYKKITIHDPCLLSKNLKDTESIRSIINKVPGIEIIEPVYNKNKTHCCGWSGTLHWADKNIAIKEASNRINELKDTGVEVFLSACPECELGLANGLSDKDKGKIKIIDISELIIKALK